MACHGQILVIHPNVALFSYDLLLQKDISLYLKYAVFIICYTSHTLVLKSHMGKGPYKICSPFILALSIVPSGYSANTYRMNSHWTAL